MPVLPSMKPKLLAPVSLIIFIYLLAVNAFVFPLIFPDGLVEKFANARAEVRPLYHLLAFAVTAVLLTILVDRLTVSRRSKIDGLFAAIALGLLVSLPEHLHLYAMIDASAVEQFIPVVWITITWGIAGIIVGYFRVRSVKRTLA